MSMINRAEVPESWQWFLHPNLDVYYFNLGMRLLTTDDIRDPNIRALIIGIRNEYYEELADDRDFKRLPIDWVMTITDCNLESRTAVVGIHSRIAGRSYEWTDRGTHMISLCLLFFFCTKKKEFFFCYCFCFADYKSNSHSGETVFFFFIRLGRKTERRFLDVYC